MSNAKSSARERITARERTLLSLVGSSDGVWDYDVSSDHLWLSPRWCEILGYRSGEVEPHLRAWRRLVHPGDWPDVLAKLKKHSAGETAIYEAEYRILARDGHWHWIRDRGRVTMRNESGLPLRIVGTHVDIHEARMGERSAQVLLAVEEAVRDCDALDEACNRALMLLGRYLDVAQTGFGAVDETQQFVTIRQDWNDDRMKSVVGTWRLEDFGPSFIGELREGHVALSNDVRSDERCQAPEIATSFAQVGTVSVLDVPLVRSNTLVALLFVHHNEARVWEVIEVRTVQQICERLWTVYDRAKTLDALEASEDRFLTASQAVRMAAWEWDRRTGLMQVSPGYDELFGLPRGRISRADQVPGMIRKEYLDHVSSRFDAAIASGDSQSLDVEFETVENCVPPRWLRCLGAVTERDQGGTALKMHGFVLDVSKQKRLEQSLRDAEARLMKLNRLSAVGVIASALTHELNQPLTAIVNGINLARAPREGSPDLDPIVVAGLESAARAAFRASEIVRRAKRFASTGEVDKSAQKISELVDRALHHCRDSMKRLDGKVDFVKSFDVEDVLVDPIQIGQVLRNLFQNALESMAGTTEGARLRVSSEVHGDQIVIAVEDNGPGLLQKNNDELFNPFVTTKDDGTGLGLAISRLIVEAHGGSLVAVPSRRGAKFLLSLPCMNDDMDGASTMPNAP